MQELYYAKGGTKDVFNCVPVRLTREDIDALEEAIKSEALPPTSGFFFGESDGTEKLDDLLFVHEARRAIETGNAVVYNSWW